MLQILSKCSYVTSVQYTVACKPKPYFYEHELLGTQCIETRKESFKRVMLLEL